MLSKILQLISQFGINPSQFLRAMIFLPRYLFGLLYFLFKSKIKVTTVFPQLADWRLDAGIARGHYFHQDILVARWIYQDNPRKHVDIASRVDGFVAHVAVFREVEVFDIRPLHTTEKNIRFHQFDLMDESIGIRDIESLSCLHSIEHFGLGRYSDPLNIDGHLIGFKNMVRMLKPKGTFYFSVPIGKTRVEFNAHRVFSLKYLKENFFEQNSLTVERFSYVNNSGELIEDCEYLKGIDDNFGCEYGVGIFKLVKE